MSEVLSHRKRRSRRELEARLAAPSPFVPTTPMPRKPVPTAQAKLRGDILREVQAEFMQKPMRVFGKWLKQELIAIGRWHR